MSCEVKICGLTRPADVIMAAEAGADYLGFVLIPSSPRFTRPELLRCAPPGVKTVCVVAGMTAFEINDLIEQFGPDVIQLHGGEPPETARAIRGAEVWRAFHLASGREVEEAAAYPAARIVADAARGGSGTACDWQWPRLLAERKSVMLAGGITAENAIRAAACGKIAGLDVASGSEILPGIKSKEKILQIIRSVKS